MRTFAMRKLVFAALVAAAVGAAGCSAPQNPLGHPAQRPSSAGALYITRPLPVAMADAPSGWTSRPPAAVTPGAVRHDPLTDICPVVSGALRQAVPATAAATDVAYAEYGITRAQRHLYPVDHLVPLVLDGNSAAQNLWPQPAAGVRAKTRTGSALHALVCAGSMTLAQAQHLIEQNWVAAYRRYVLASPSPTAGGSPPPGTAGPTEHPGPGPSQSQPPSPPSSPPPSSAPPEPAPQPSPSPTHRPVCYPHNSSGDCYTEGEFCPFDEHNQSGVAADGKPITCEENMKQLWLWEPAS
jgi:hypothetical protein